MEVDERKLKEELRYHPKKLKEGFKNNPEAVMSVLANELKMYGCPQSKEWVKGEMERLLAGGKPGDTASSFLSLWLERGIL